MALTNLVSIVGLRPKTMGNGPLQVGATAARARALISPLLKARTAMLAAWPPPIITKDSPENLNHLHI